MVDLEYLKELGQDLDIADLDHVYDGAEIYFSHALLRWLAQYHQLKLSEISHDELTMILQDQTDLVSYAEKVIGKLGLIDSSGSNPLYNLGEDFNTDLFIFWDDPIDDVYGRWIQESLGFDNRKTLASNYTENATDVISAIYQEKSAKVVSSVCDHFCGSGNLILGVLSQLSDDPDLIRINDLMPSPVLLAFCRIVQYGFSGTIEATIQDGFTVEGEFDIVVINPPYTRSHRINATIKQNYQYLQEKVEEYSTGHAGLHFWAVLGLEDLLSDEGNAIIVLPRASINARYSKALKDHLLERYAEIQFIEYSTKKAFSYGSDLKELILTLSTKGRNLLQFNSLTSDLELRVIQTVPYDVAKRSWNWGMFFLPQEAVELGKDIIATIGLQSRSELRTVDMTIKRGIELYGPNAFFFPNRNWTIDHNGAEVKLKRDGSSISLPSNYFQRILRKPNLYTSSITPEVKHFVITLPEKKNGEIERFLSEIRSETKAAQNRFGKDWYRHPTVQIEQKNPTGHIFIIDKLDLTATPTLAYYTDDAEICTKNFYVVEMQTEDPNLIKFMAAWLNSTIYLFLYLLHRREIGGTYGRLQIIDYDHHPLFPPLGELGTNTTQIKEILDAFDILRQMKVGNLLDQLYLDQKIILDQLLLSYFDINIEAEEVHRIVEDIIDSRNS